MGSTTVGTWHLDGLPNPRKNPLEEADGAVRSIRSDLMRHGAVEGADQLVWLLRFTAIGRHQFGAHASSDLTSFKRKLAWAEDLRRPSAIMENVLNKTFEVALEARSTLARPEEAARTGPHRSRAHPAVARMRTCWSTDIASSSMRGARTRSRR